MLVIWDMYLLSGKQIIPTWERAVLMRDSGVCLTEGTGLGQSQAEQAELLAVGHYGTDIILCGLWVLRLCVSGWGLWAGRQQPWSLCGFCFCPALPMLHVGPGLPSVSARDQEIAAGFLAATSQVSWHTCLEVLFIYFGYACVQPLHVWESGQLCVIVSASTFMCVLGNRACIVRFYPLNICFFKQP